MFKRSLSIVSTIAMVGASLLGQTAHAAAPGTMNFKFMTYAQAGYPEQDVFVLSAATSTQVVRVPAADIKFRSNLDKQAYAAASPVAHDLFKTGPTPLGPFLGGKALPFTMNDWQAAKGNGTYSLNDSGSGTLSLSFEKLVPNGIYTVTCGRITPSTQSVEEATCVAADGSESALRANDQGKATFRLALKDLLAQSSAEVSTVVGLEYHSDSLTCAGQLCGLGVNGHVQLIAMLPTPNAMTRAECLADALKTKNASLTDVRKNYLTGLTNARKVNLDALAKARKDHDTAIKTANADRRDIEAQARQERQTALDQAKTNFTAATLSASTTDDRALVKEDYDAAKDKVASDFEMAMDQALINAHNALNKAQAEWDAAKNAAQTHWDADKDHAKLIWDEAKGAAMATFHASRTSCVRNSLIP